MCTGTKLHTSVSHLTETSGFQHPGMPVKYGLAATALFLPWAKPTLSHVLQKGCLWGSKSEKEHTQPLLAQYTIMSHFHLCLSSMSELGPCHRMLRMVQILWDTNSANPSGRTYVMNYKTSTVKRIIVWFFFFNSLFNV